MITVIPPSLIPPQNLLQTPPPYKFLFSIHDFEFQFYGLPSVIWAFRCDDNASEISMGAK